MRIRKLLKNSYKYLFFSLLFLSVLSFKTNNVIPVSASTTIITTRATDTYINNYYSSISDSLTGSELASALESRLKAERKSSFSYGSLQTSAFPYTDVDPTRPNEGYIVSFYSGTPVKGYSGMNKEHTWPNSHGGNKIENDPHMVRPTISSENSSRGNEYFSNTASGWDPAELGDVQARGMAARITLYGAVIGKSSGLELEDVGRGQGGGTGNKMGKLGDLLKWNLDYPVNQKEIIRNETLDISLDYNRNPFIDRPDYACKIWGDTNTNTQTICASYSPVEVTGISVSPTSDTINLLSTDKTTQLTASLSPSNATNKGVTWTSSNNSVATVSSSGLVTGHAVGQATIFATSQGNPTKVAQASIQVVSTVTPVSGITLNKTTITLGVGKSETLVETITPSGATNKVVTWSSSNTNVATVSNGLVNGVSQGMAVITVTSNDGSYTATTLVTVTQAVPSVVVVGSFYNTSTGNSGGDVNNDTTLKNLMNSGTNTSPSYSGFNNTNVIKTIEGTQRYLPRGGGLALGSGSNAGSIKVTLNDDYATSKVEVLINGSTSGASASLATNVTPKSNVNGTNGVQFSNPSASTYTGTPYVLEFNSSHNYFEINTTKRMIVVEIRLTVGEASSSSSANDEAIAWSDNFLALTSEGCLTSNPTLLQTAWDEGADTFALLSNDAQLLIKNSSGTYNVEDSVSHAKARYNVIRNQYGFYDFFNGIFYSGISSQDIVPVNKQAIYIIIMASITVFSLYLYIVKRKKKQV